MKNTIISLFDSTQQILRLVLAVKFMSLLINPGSSFFFDTVTTRCPGAFSLFMNEFLLTFARLRFQNTRTLPDAKRHRGPRAEP